MSQEYGGAERIRRWSAVPVAFLASALGVASVVNLAYASPRVEDLTRLDERFVGWAGVATALGVAAAAIALLTVGKVGPGPALALGAAASVFGLALAEQVVAAFQLTLLQVLLAVAAACLLAGAASMTFELPDPYRRAAMAAWALPVACSWPVLAWLSRHVGPIAGADDPRLTVHPTAWLLAPVSAGIVAWGALSMLLEPPRVQVRSGRFWESAWSAVLSIFAAVALATMALGFDAGLPSGWLRPLLLFVSAGLVVGLAALTLVLPEGRARIGYLCVVFVVVLFPTTVQLVVLTADQGSARVSGWMAALLAGVVATGTALGARRPRLATGGLLVVAAACAGCWVMPDTQGWMAAGAVPLCAGMGTVFGAGSREAAAGASAWRFTVMTVVGVVLLSTVTGVALGWALGGDIPADTDSMRDAGRVLLGVTFSLAVVAAAAVSVLRPAPQSGRRGGTGTPVPAPPPPAASTPGPLSPGVSVLPDP